MDIENELAMLRTLLAVKREGGTITFVPAESPANSILILPEACDESR